MVKLDFFNSLLVHLSASRRGVAPTAHACEFRRPRLEFLMSLRPNLEQKPLLGYTANHLARVAERRGDAAFLAARARRIRAQRRSRSAANSLCSRGARTGSMPCSARARCVRSRRPRKAVFLGIADNAGRFGIALDPRGHQGAQGPIRPARDRSSLDRRAGARGGATSSRRSPRRKRCSPGTHGIVSAPTADRRRTSRRPAGSASARAARSSTSRAPIRS